ncbi:MAG: YceI family protein [Bacteroidales bacterium]|nr:YceI family protein [Bacteroidales bacterium]
MKTRKLFFPAVVALAMIAVSCSQGNQKQTSESASEAKTAVEISSVNLDPAKSMVIWSGTMLGIYTHDGTLDLSQAELALDDGKISGGSFTVDMNSMVATDENYNPEEGSTPEKLIGHLKSPDFFDVENYPTATFIITSADANTVSGMLTIRGITHEEIVQNVSMAKDGGQVKITGDMTISRKKYDVSWDSPMQDRVLSDDIKLEIRLIGK